MAIYTNMHMHTCVCVCMCIYIYIYIYTYVYVREQELAARLALGAMGGAASQSDGSESDVEIRGNHFSGYQSY